MPAAAAVVVVVERVDDLHRVLWPGLCDARLGDAAAAAAGFFTVWSWVAFAVVGAHAALPMLAGVALAAAYTVHVHPREIRVPLARNAVAVVRPPALFVLDGVTHLVPLALALLLALLRSERPAPRGRAALVGPLLAVALYVAVGNDPAERYGLRPADMALLAAAYACGVAVLWGADRTAR